MTLTPQEFQSAFFQIEARWKKAYNADQVALIKDVSDKYSFEQFRSVCTRLLGSMRSAPMVPDFEKCFTDLRIVPRGNNYYPSAASPVQSEANFEYQLRDNIFADNNYIFIRGNTVRTCSFIVKADHPTHPLVLEDREVRSSRLQEIKSKNDKAYKGETRQSQPDGFRVLSFNGENA